MLDFIKLIRENLKDPKKKAITQLLLYVIFCAIVFLLISNADSNHNSNYTVKKEKTLSYNYSIDITNNNLKTILNGIYSKDKESFNYNNLEYEIKNNTFYLDNIEVNNPLSINLIDYYYDNIKELISKSEFIEKTTYKDETIKTIYNIKVSDYFINSTYECINNCDSVITITVYEKDYINEVIINLDSVNKGYAVDIKYENVVSE